MKYVIITGGVCSSLGKGVATSSLGVVLQSYGYHVTAIKIDPYINEDAGLMSPFEHGEVYVLDDGGEVDLDLGNYERALGLTLARENNITTGKIYRRLLTKERKGEYLGKTVQVVPHFTTEVKRHIERVSRIPTDGSEAIPDICLIEVGGTVGDIESMPFLEALRLMKHSLPEDSSLAILHLSYLPRLSGQKTKPTQHSVRALQSLGLQPHLIACRCDTPVETETAEKIASLCNVRPSEVISLHNVASLYEVPLILHSQNIVEKLSLHLGLPSVATRPVPLPSILSEVYSNLLSPDSAPQDTKTSSLSFLTKEPQEQQKERSLHEQQQQPSDTCSHPQQHQTQLNQPHGYPQQNVTQPQQQIQPNPPSGYPQQEKQQQQQQQIQPNQSSGYPQQEQEQQQIQPNPPSGYPQQEKQRQQEQQQIQPNPPSGYPQQQQEQQQQQIQPNQSSGYPQQEQEQQQQPTSQQPQPPPLPPRTPPPLLRAWSHLFHASRLPPTPARPPLRVAFVGKYVTHGSGLATDTYFSVVKALEHAALACGRPLELCWVAAEALESEDGGGEGGGKGESKAGKGQGEPLESVCTGQGTVRENAERVLLSCGGVFIPGGFGSRGVNGMIRAAELARTKKIPYFGVCLGFQIALLEMARNVLHMENAVSEEFDTPSGGVDAKTDTNGGKAGSHAEPGKPTHHILKWMPEVDRETMGANMRLGSRRVFFPEALQQKDKILSPIVETQTMSEGVSKKSVNSNSEKLSQEFQVKQGRATSSPLSMSFRMYGCQRVIRERHRHRYEFNTEYKSDFENCAHVTFPSMDHTAQRMEGIELNSSVHPFFLAVQYHPEFKSRPFSPSPPFYLFMKAVAEGRDGVDGLLQCLGNTLPAEHYRTSK